LQEKHIATNGYITQAQFNTKQPCHSVSAVSLLLWFLVVCLT
jgi:hypothetical protein